MGFSKIRFCLAVTIILILSLQIVAEFGQSTPTVLSKSLRPIDQAKGRTGHGSPLSPATSSISGTCISSWPQFHGDASHSGYSCYNGPINNSTLWISQPRFQPLYDSNYALVSSNHLLIVDSSAGVAIWSDFEQNGTFDFQYNQCCNDGYLHTVYPPIGGGLIYSVYCCVETLESNFFSTGVLAGNAPLPSNTYAPNGLLCSPFTGTSLQTYDNGALLEAAYNSPSIGAYQASSVQNVLWAQETLKGPIDTFPTIGTPGNIAVVGYSSANFLSAINATTGKPAWNFTTNAQVIGTPSFANGNFFFGTAWGTVYSVSVTGTQNWSSSLGSGVLDATPAIANGDAFVATDDNHIYALNATSGAKIWSFTSNGAFIASPAVSHNGVVYDGCTDGFVYALNATNGRMIWSYDTKAPITASPVIDAYSSANLGALFVVNQVGKIFAFPDPVAKPTHSIDIISQWTQYQGSAAHNGAGSTIGPLTPLNLWKTQTIGSDNTVIAAYHQVFATSRQNNQILSLDEQNGSKISSYQWSGSLLTDYPATDGALLFFSQTV